MTEVVIVDALRTATGRRKGMFADTHPVDMLTPILKELVKRNDVSAGEVEEVVTGCVTMTDEQGGNIGRMAVLAAGFPVEVPAYSLNRMCGSSQQAIHSASQQILAGDADIEIGCGGGNMNSKPTWTDRGGCRDYIVNKFDISTQGYGDDVRGSKQY